MPSLTEYFLGRTFLMFAMLCASPVAFFSLVLFETNQISFFSVIYAAVIFLLVVAVVTAWMITLGALLTALLRRNIIKTIYTPIFYLAGLAAFIAAYYIQFGTQVLGQALLPSLIWIGVFACIDLMHAHFVAPRHPNFVDARQGHEPMVAQPNVPAIAAQQQNVLPAPERTMPPAAFAPPEAFAPVQPQEDSAPAEPVSNNLVKIGSHEFKLASILQVRSEDHYLQVRLASETVFIRGKLSDVAEKLPADFGTQINRSIWVAHSEIESLENAERGRLVLNLRDGESLLVPKTRKLLLKQRFDDFQASRQQPRGPEYAP